MAEGVKDFVMAWTLADSQRDAAMHQWWIDAPVKSPR